MARLKTALPTARFIFSRHHVATWQPGRDKPPTTQSSYSFPFTPTSWQARLKTRWQNTGSVNSEADLQMKGCRHWGNSFCKMPPSMHTPNRLRRFSLSVSETLLCMAVTKCNPAGDGEYESFKGFAGAVFLINDLQRFSCVCGVKWLEIRDV